MQDDKRLAAQPSRRALMLAIGGAMLLPRLARAAVSVADQPDVNRVQNYMNGIHTLASRFDQVAEDGSTASGKIYLQRPGHMRIEYDSPNPILLVAAQGEVFYYDGKLDQVSWVPLDDTPAWFLLQENIKMGGDITVENVRHDPGVLRLSLYETKRAQNGQVTLVLQENPLELRQWTVVDAQKKHITVTLSNPQFGVQINPQLFIWTDPHSSGSRGG